MGLGNIVGDGDLGEGRGPGAGRSAGAAGRSARATGEFFEGVEGSEEGAAGGVDAVLEAGEGGSADAAFDSIETAEEPLTFDEAVDELAGDGGLRAVMIVVFAGEAGAVGGVLPGEHRRFCEDSRAEVGGDNAAATGRGGGAMGSAAVGARGGVLGGGAHRALARFAETPGDGERLAGDGIDGLVLWADDFDITVAGFQAFELAEGGVQRASSGVDAVLERIEGGDALDASGGGGVLGVLCAELSPSDSSTAWKRRRCHSHMMIWSTRQRASGEAGGWRA